MALATILFRFSLPPDGDVGARMVTEGFHLLLDRLGHTYWYTREGYAYEHTAAPDWLEGDLFRLCDDLFVALLERAGDEGSSAAVLRSAVDMLRLIVGVVYDTRHVRALLVTLAGRVSPMINAADLSGDLSTSIKLLSRDCEALPMIISQAGTAESDSETEEEVEAVRAEGSVLNLSGNRLETLHSPHHPALAGDSDWDSWEEEEELDSTTLALLGSFLLDLASFLTTPKANRRRNENAARFGRTLSSYEDIWDALPSSDQHALKWLREQAST